MSGLPHGTTGEPADGAGDGPGHGRTDDGPDDDRSAPSDRSGNRPAGRTDPAGDGDTARPLLLLDVDGPLNPFARKFRIRPRGYTTHRFRPAGWVTRHAPLPAEQVEDLRVWLRPEHGAQLKALPYELVWATTWMHDANDCIGPVLGLPRLPVIEWPELFRPELDGLHWKARQIVEWAEGRPFAWVDDGITPKERRFVAAHHEGPALLLRVDPRLGLRQADFAALAEWAEGLARDGRTARPDR